MEAFEPVSGAGCYLYQQNGSAGNRQRNTRSRVIKSRLSDACIDFSDDHSDEFYESIAMTDEHLLEEYLEHGKIEKPSIAKAVKERKIFPVFLVLR